MARQSGDKRRASTIIRDNGVHDAYVDLKGEMGQFAHVVAKSYIYGRLSERTGLCTKTIAFILNHTVKHDLTIGGGKIKTLTFAA